MIDVGRSYIVNITVNKEINEPICQVKCNDQIVNKRGHIDLQFIEGDKSEVMRTILGMELGWRGE